MGNNITIEIEGIDNLRNKLKTYSDKAVKEVKRQVFISANNIKNKAQDLCPVSPPESGHAPSRLKHSIGVSYASDNLGAEISTNVEYAAFVEYGTGPHIIEAKNAKVLTDGVNFFGKRVMHPGTKAQPFMNPAAEEERNPFTDSIKAILNGNSAG